MSYSLQQLVALAQGAGFTVVNADIAAAIAEAESGGNATAYNPETGAHTASGMGSYGLWQVYRTAHPNYSVSQLDNPQGNALAAFQIYKAAGNSFSPWSTYNSGAYQQYLNDLLSGSAVSPSTTPTSVVQGTPTGLSLNPADWIAAIQTGFTDVAQRTGLAFFGGLLVLIGVIVLFFSSGAAEESEKVAEGAAVAAA